MCIRVKHTQTKGERSILDVRFLMRVFLNLDVHSRKTHTQTKGESKRERERCWWRERNMKDEAREKFL